MITFCVFAFRRSIKWNKVKSNRTFSMEHNPSLTYNEIHCWCWCVWRSYTAGSIASHNVGMACYIFAQLVFNCQKRFVSKCCSVHGNGIAHFPHFIHVPLAAIYRGVSSSLSSIGRFIRKVFNSNWEIKCRTVQLKLCANEAVQQVKLRFTNASAFANSMPELLWNLLFGVVEVVVAVDAREVCKSKSIE